MRRGWITGEGPAGQGRRYSGASLAGFIVLWSSPLLAGQWQVHPTADLSEIYTDNVTLAPDGGGNTDFVTQITPGISVHGQGARSKLDLDYHLQNLIYANNGNDNSTYNQLRAKGTLELMKDVFFMDAQSSITQQIVDVNGRSGLDNLNLTGNRADVGTYGLSPYLKLNWKSYINSSWRYGIDRVENQSAQIADAEMQNYAAHVGSGPEFRRFLWNVDYQRQDLNRSNGSDSRRASTSGDFRYRLSSKWNFLMLGGYEDNSLPTSQAVRNGSYWSAGLEWQPSRLLKVSTTDGNKYRDTRISFQPTVRTSLHMEYRNQDVGLTTGANWNIGISHRTLRTTWQASYSEQNTTTQILQITGQQNFTLVDSQGNIVRDPTTGQPIVLSQNVFSLTNDEFLSKRGQLSMTMDTGRSNIVFSAFSERRTSVINNTAEDALGTTASWTWRFAPRLRSMFGGGWQRRNPSNNDGHDDLWNTSIALIRAVDRYINTSVEFRHIARDSYIPNDNYRENRVTVQLSARF